MPLAMDNLNGIAVYASISSCSTPSPRSSCAIPDLSRATTCGVKYGSLSPAFSSARETDACFRFVLPSKKDVICRGNATRMLFCAVSVVIISPVKNANIADMVCGDKGIFRGVWDFPRFPTQRRKGAKIF